MGKDSFKVVCYGEILWDILPSGAKPGGAPVNVAFHLNQLGQRPAIISKVGSDQRGAALKELLEGHYIATTYVQEDPVYQTGIVHATPDEQNNMRYDIIQPVAWDYIDLTEPQFELLKTADYFIFGSLAARSPTSHRTLFELLEQARQKVLDINLRMPYYNKQLILDLITRADILKLNDEELELITGWFSNYRDIDDRILQLEDRFQLSTIIVTRGANGAIVRKDGVSYNHSGYQVKVEDTVGSGDSFLAAYLSKTIEGVPPVQALNYASAVGAKVASSAGAWVSYKQEDIELFLEAQLDPGRY